MSGSESRIRRCDNGFYNLQDAFESIRRLNMIAAVTKGTLIPSHAPAVWETFNPAPYVYT